MRMERTAAYLKAEPPPMRLLLLAVMALTGSEAGQRPERLMSWSVRHGRPVQPQAVQQLLRSGLWCKSCDFLPSGQPHLEPHGRMPEVRLRVCACAAGRRACSRHQEAAVQPLPGGRVEDAVPLLLLRLPSPAQHACMSCFLTMHGARIAVGCNGWDC